MRHHVRSGKVALMMIIERRHVVTASRIRTKDETTQSKHDTKFLHDDLPHSIF